MTLEVRPVPWATAVPHAMRALDAFDPRVVSPARSLRSGADIDREVINPILARFPRSRRRPR